MGEKAGHPFRGNQFTSSKGGGKGGGKGVGSGAQFADVKRRIVAHTKAADKAAFGGGSDKTVDKIEQSAYDKHGISLTVDRRPGFAGTTGLSRSGRALEPVMERWESKLKTKQMGSAPSMNLGPGADLKVAASKMSRSDFTMDAYKKAKLSGGVPAVKELSRLHGEWKAQQRAAGADAYGQTTSAYRSAAAGAGVPAGGPSKAQQNAYNRASKIAAKKLGVTRDKVPVGEIASTAKARKATADQLRGDRKAARYQRRIARSNPGAF